MECGITIPPCFRNPKATGHSLCEAQRSPVRGRLRLPACSPMSVGIRTLRLIPLRTRALVSLDRRAGRRDVPSKAEPRLRTQKKERECSQCFGVRNQDSANGIAFHNTLRQISSADEPLVSGHVIFKGQSSRSINPQPTSKLLGSP